MNTQNILDNLSNEFGNLEAIEKKLFKVLDVEVPAPFAKEGGVPFENPQTKLIYTDMGKYLGTTGHIYESLQPKDFFKSVVDNINSCNIDLDLSKLEYNERNNSKVIEFKIPTGVFSINNSRGKEDTTELIISLSTGFGGAQRTEVGLYSKRFICSNGMRIIHSETELKVKHTNLMNVKALDYCNELYKTLGKVQETKEMWTAMHSKQVSTAAVEKFALSLAEIKANEEKLSTRKSNILDKINEGIAIEFARTGTNVYGLLQGATYYTNHLASGASEDYVISQKGRITNELAQKLCIALI